MFLFSFHFIAISITIMCAICGFVLGLLVNLSPKSMCIWRHFILALDRTWTHTQINCFLNAARKFSLIPWRNCVWHLFNNVQTNIAFVMKSMVSKLNFDTYVVRGEIERNYVGFVCASYMDTCYFSCNVCCKREFRQPCRAE